ncbi:MAG TPA: Ku protein [Rhizomicrobium sp.]|nr:Ku protein [Rhizomicrobium sp.]
MAARKKTKASTHRRPNHKAATARGHHRPANSNEPHLSSRPVWQGSLRLSLVSCPVALYGATSRTADISFHLLNPETNNRIRMIPTDPDTGPVERADLVKGYEISKNHYVVLSSDELQSVRLETTRTIDIERFVDAKDIDRLYWNDPYYLLPNDKSGVEAYTVIREALAETGRIALGRVVMHTRERLVALEPRDKGIIVYTLRMGDEVIQPKDAFGEIPTARPSKQMIEIARKIIEQQEGAFEPEKFEDRYENALRDLIRRKEKGEKLVTAEPVEEDNVIDLMEALKKSLKSKGRSVAAKAPGPKRKAR